MTLPEPSYDVATPANSFELRTGDNVLLARLPPTLAVTGTLGSPRTLDWERAPYSGNWRPVGDNLATEPPSLTLQGPALYATADEALAEMALIEDALSRATLLVFRDRLYCTLRTDRRGLYLPSFDGQARRVTHLLSLYPTEHLTPGVIAANQGAPLPPAGEGPTNATQTTTTILIMGVETPIPVWRTNA